MNLAQDVREIRHAHFFCGLGGGAKGFNAGTARVGNMQARFRCLGGIDVDPASCLDFEKMAGVPATCLDLFDRDQFTAFHGREPSADWREAGVPDIHRAFGYERPHIVFLSAPCKGFSSLLPEKSAASARYQALNRLTLRGIWLMLEAYRDDPVELIVFENVPRIMVRGRPLLDQIIGLLRHYGYAAAETTHDCGHLGGLAQSRKRFLLVARYVEKVPPFLYEPPHKPLRGVGEVLDQFPVPGPEAVLPMHRVPSLQWRTWVRLAFVRAGADWRSLNELAVSGGVLSDYGIAAEREWHRGALGVREWDQPSGTVTSRAGPTNGAYAIADPRIDGHPKSVQHGVREWDKPAGVVTGKMLVGGGPHSVADPRLKDGRFNNIYRIVSWADASPAVTGGGTPSAGGLAVADPRAGTAYGGAGKYHVAGHDEPARTVIAGSTTGHGAFAVADPRTNWADTAHTNKLAVRDWDKPAGTVTGADRVGSGAFSVADPRPAGFAGGRENFEGGGHYGVVEWKEPALTVAGHSRHDNGRFSVADPRPAAGEGAGLPAPDDRLFAVIRALDGTWHRPFTTLELAALQGLVAPDDLVELEGQSDSGWRERIGNAVPPPAAAAIASSMARTLLLAWSGETFVLSSEPIWVRPIETALAVRQPEDMP
ncbi:MAG: DNA cytosine methyltransferase [Pseudomonadota bacterium]|nr:DNA cytosine methyltransferase [Pseudomonadota bacterium]